MIYTSKLLPNQFRSRIWQFITSGLRNPSYTAANTSNFIINFYEGEIPADITSTYTFTGSSATTTTTIVNGVATSNIPNTLLAKVTNTSFLNFVQENGNYLSIQVPLQLEYVADGTIGFYEFIFMGKAGNWSTSLPATNSYNHWYDAHPKSAFYGSVGRLSTGKEIILDSLECTSANVPYLYELGFNPTITV